MIRIQNIYHMLAYAFHVLHEKGYRSIATEPFENTAELCAAILIRGITMQIKRGLHCDYTPRTDLLSTVRGKIDVTKSIKTLSRLRKQIVCSYDDFSVNTTMNQIIKSTMILLLRANIKRERKTVLRKLIIYLNKVEIIDLHSVNWLIQYNRNNQTYRMLIAICHLVVKGLLQTQSDGTTKIMDFMDEQSMHKLYERFILEYYRQEFTDLTANASRIPWQLDDGIRDMLPVMQTDIMLSCKGRVLIIDAKYYGTTTQQQFGVHTLHSNNLYQIFTYVKNKELELSGTDHKVAGMLLYARTDELVLPDNEYQMSGNRIAVRTLDLNRYFPEIAEQLYRIADSFFEGCPIACT